MVGLSVLAHAPTLPTTALTPLSHPRRCLFIFLAPGPHLHDYGLLILSMVGSSSRRGRCCYPHALSTTLALYGLLTPHVGCLSTRMRGVVHSHAGVKVLLILVHRQWFCWISRNQERSYLSVVIHVLPQSGIRYAFLCVLWFGTSFPHAQAVGVIFHVVSHAH